MGSSNFIKVLLRCDKETTGVETERIWAELSEDDDTLAQIANLPFFTTAVNFEDWVRVRKVEGNQYDFVEVVERSGMVGFQLHFESAYFPQNAHTMQMIKTAFDDVHVEAASRTYIILAIEESQSAALNNLLTEMKVDGFIKDFSHNGDFHIEEVIDTESLVCSNCGRSPGEVLPN